MPLQDSDCKTPSAVAAIDLDDASAVPDLQTPGNSAPIRRLWQGTSAVETPEKLVSNSSGSMSNVAVDLDMQVTEYLPSASTASSSSRSVGGGAAEMGMQITEFVPTAATAGGTIGETAAGETEMTMQITELERAPMAGNSSASPDGAADVDLGMQITEFVAMGSSADVDASVPIAGRDAEIQDSSMLPVQADSQIEEWMTVDGYGMPSLPAAPPSIGAVQVNVSMGQLEASLARRKRLHASNASTTEADAKDSTSRLQFSSGFSLSSLAGNSASSASLEEVAKFATSSDASDVTSTSSGLRFDKSYFSKMRVIGQFNLGFIIAALQTEQMEDGQKGAENSARSVSAKPKGQQLFIVDQHASDERYRFEGLNRESKIDRQPLVSPHYLQLTPAQEQLAESHLEVFRLNGFEITKDDSRPPGRRLQLKTLPTCQGLMFGDKDIHDLLYTLEQAESERGAINLKDTSQKSTGLLDLEGHRGLWSATALPRPPKVWGLLANRACRYAIMIGKALRASEMEKVLSNLGTLQQPWNCPHGRPTMRHLIDTTSAWQTPRRPEPLAGYLK
jgi:hypothetical protein